MSIDVCHISLNRSIPVDKQMELDDPKYLELAKQALLRDSHQCYFCQFQAVKIHQQVITKNGYYRKEDFTLDNMVTVCPYCFLGQRIGHAALTDEITFIYCPELTQPEVNNLMRQIFFYSEMRVPDHDEYSSADLPLEIQAVIDMKDHAALIMEEFKNRVRLVSEQYRYANLGHLKTIATLLFDLNEEQYRLRGKFFKNIRYLVKPTTMKKFNEIYKVTVFSHMNGVNELNASKIVTTIDSSIFG
jgi:hypothetical protein